MNYIRTNAQTSKQTKYSYVAASVHLLEAVQVSLESSQVLLLHVAEQVLDGQRGHLDGRGRVHVCGLSLRPADGGQKRFRWSRNKLKERLNGTEVKEMNELINDLFTYIRFGRPFLFADDIKLVYSCDRFSTNDLLMDIQTDLKSLEDWCLSWSMLFSTEKCNAISHGFTIPTNSLLLHNTSLPVTQCVRDLGLRYSCTLNFNEHVSYQVARARRLSALILRLFHIKDARVTIFKTCVRPLLEYCAIIYSSIRKSDWIALENVQRSFSKSL